ncbi:MAG: hypothetical protein IKB34_03140 [Clostridia bacterium]|nr:hypothetical protein [Clostridia bacterium]
MKKIRFLSLLLVFLMIVLPVFAACDKDDENPDESSSSSSSSSSSKTTIDRGEQNEPMAKEGYLMWEDFNSYAVGTYTGTVVTTAVKDGVSYKIVEADNFAEGEEAARAFQLNRVAGASGSTDGVGDFKPRLSGLSDIYVVEFDFMAEEDNVGSVYLTGRKQPPGGNAVFNKFVEYNGATGLLTANGLTAATLEPMRWYKISVVLDDQNQSYDVYVDGYKVLAGVDYENIGGYPKRSATEINLYRISMVGGNALINVCIDNVCIYLPADADNHPNDYKGNLATTYEKVPLADLVLFDAETATMEDVYNWQGADRTAKLNGYQTIDGPKTDGVDLKDANCIVAISADGKDIQYLVENYGEEVTDAVVNPGYTKYLQLDGYAAGFNEIKITPNVDIMTAAGVPATEDIGKNPTWDISNYQTITIEYYVPEAVYNKTPAYTFMEIVDTGNNDVGWSYYSHVNNSNDAHFVDGGGFYSLTMTLRGMGLNRSPSLTTFRHVQWSFSGWSNGAGGQASDDYPIYVKSIKLSSEGVRLPVVDPEEGKENCTHVLEDETTAFTEEVVVQPTCLDLGYTGVKCELCGAVVPTENSGNTLIPAAGHQYGTPEENERDVIYPTCTTGGDAKAACIYCGDVAVIETYAPLGHSYTTKIDTVKKVLRFSCGVCGYTTTSNFAEEAATYANLKQVVTDAGRTMYKSGFAGIDAAVGSGHNYIGTDTNASWSVGAMRFYSQGAKAEVLRDYLVDENGEFVLDDKGNKQFDNESIPFARYYWKSRAHSYINVDSVHSANSDDIIFELSLRLGPQVDGKRPNYADLQIIDRSTTAQASGGNLFHAIAGIQDALTFKTSTFSVPLSEDYFTNIAIAFHFSSNTLDVYVDGVMKGQDIPISNNPAINAAAMCPDEFRLINVNGASTAPEDPVQWIDVSYVAAYSGSFPAAFTDVQLDGVVPAYSGDIINVDFNDDFDLEAEENAYINTNGVASVVDNALVIKNTTGEEKFVEFNVDREKQNTTYIVAFNMKGNENGFKDGVLLQGVKGNYYGEDLVEDILTVDADGDILFYSSIIANTADDAFIELAVDEDNGIINAYVDGELIASGYYENADYYNVEDEVYLSAFRFGAAGEYALDDFVVYTGYYGEE